MVEGRERKERIASEAEIAVPDFYSFSSIIAYAARTTNTSHEDRLAFTLPGPYAVSVSKPSHSTRSFPESKPHAISKTSAWVCHYGIAFPLAYSHASRIRRRQGSNSRRRESDPKPNPNSKRGTASVLAGATKDGANASGQI